jgi:hypothetical protein
VDFHLQVFLEENYPMQDSKAIMSLLSIGEFNVSELPNVYFLFSICG